MRSTAAVLVTGTLAFVLSCGDDSEPEYLTLGDGITGMIHPTEEGRLSSHTDAPVIEITFPSDDTVLPPELAPLATFDESSAVGPLEASDSTRADRVLDPPGRPSARRVPRGPPDPRRP